MSPGEAAREKTLELLADPVNGLNPAFVHGCQKRQIPVPFAGDGGNPAAPFDFSPTSNNVFRMREDIDWLSKNSNQQYPCLVAFSGSARQSRSGRPMRAKFSGSIQIDLLFYVAWYVQDTEGTTNFEAHLDALEEALLVVLNAEPTDWTPLRYSNLLDTEERLPLQTCNGDQCVRRGLRFRLTADLTM